MTTGSHQWEQDAKNRHILSAGMSLFSERGYHGADVEDIARLAGVGKGTIYRHFGAKKDLFTAVVDWGLSTLKNEMAERLSDLAEPKDRMRTALETYLAFFDRHREFYRILAEERGEFREDAGRRFRDKHLEYLYLFERVLKRGMETGTFKSMDTRSVAIAVIGLTNALIFRWLVSAESYPLMRELPVITEICFSGILSSQRGRVTSGSATGPNDDDRMGREGGIH